MKRNLQQLGSKEYDLLVIGGGIYGACIAWEGSSRGLSVALVEKGDFGNATSSNSLKTIHGGLRYLQHLDFKRMRESIRERSVLLKIAPHMVRPIPFLMPTYGWKKGKAVMTAALLCNDIIGFDKNKHLSDPAKLVPSGKVISRDECIKHLPEVKTSGLTGGALWYDCHVHNSERLLLSFLTSAVDAGADIANYLGATGFIESGNRIYGITVKDELNNDEFDIRARLTINAAGPWLDKVLGMSKNVKFAKKFYPSVAVNVVSPSVSSSGCALGINSTKVYRSQKNTCTNGSRMLIVLPWRSHSLIGTAHLPYDGDPDQFAVKEQELAGFINEANSCNVDFNVNKVKFIYSGLLPMEKKLTANGEVILEKQYQICDHKREDGLDGIISVLGVKYTTARDVAEKAIDLAGEKLNKSLSESISSFTPVAGGKIEHFDDYLQHETANHIDGASPELVGHLIKNYGSNYTDIVEYIKKDPNQGTALSSNVIVSRAEVLHAVREEMAVKLSDVVLRRTSAGTLGHPGEKTLRVCASIMASELGWNQKRVEDETDEINNVYERIEKLSQCVE